MELGKAITIYRLKRGLTQKELAKRSGISEIYLGLIEGGKRKPHIKTLARIANCLDVELELILRES